MILIVLIAVGPEISLSTYLGGDRGCGHRRRLYRARGHVPPLLQMVDTGALRVEEQKKENDQNVLTSTKALTKTTNCTFRAKTWRDTPTKIRAGHVPPLADSFRRYWMWLGIVWWQ